MLLKSFAKSVLAGIYIGLACMGMVLVRSYTGLPPMISSLLAGLIFSAGLFFVFTLNGQLFTGALYNSYLIFLKRGRVIEYVIGMAYCLVWNVLGITLVAAIAKNLIFYPDVARMIAAGKFSQSIDSMFFRAIMCNVLIIIAVRINIHARTVIDKFMAALIPVTLFVAFGFEHSIADCFFVCFVNYNLIPVTTVVALILTAILGNVIGGVGLTALFYCSDKVIQNG